jgi:Na+-translocating ferredoxin:NAD+ oxidoreductase subunit C
MPDKLKTFPKGGIHPPENKVTASRQIQVLDIPGKVVIPVSQHLGASSEIVVNKGDKVKAGQVLARSRGYVSAFTHSSVSGEVEKLDYIIDSTGFKQSAVFITTSGDEWLPEIDRSNALITENNDSPAEIVRKCMEAGIVGMGGATFPSHVKLTVPEGKRCDILIINGVECEPFLTSDHRLMLEKGNEIMVGITLLMKALGTNRAMIGIEKNKSDAIDSLERISKEFHGISVHPLKVKYPQGAEKQLIKALINREVPARMLPIDVNTVVHNVGTAFAIYEAVQKRKPLFERVVTVTGKSLRSPGNFLARIGTPVSFLLEAAGGLPENTGKVVSGGPMMGKALVNIDVPVVKGMSGIILFPADEAGRSTQTTCIRCGKCVTACALGMEPYLLVTLSEKGLFEQAEKEGITNCMECGSCAYVCPGNRPLLDYIRLGKSTVNKNLKERAEKSK